MGLRRILSWTSIVRVLAPAGALILEGWPALLGALLIQEGGIWVAARLTANCERRFARQLFLAAYALRVVIALPTHYAAKLGNGNGALFQDDYTGDLVGEWLLRIARGDGGVSIFAGHQHLLDSIYSYFLMGVYAVFGYSPLVPKLINIGLASLCAVLVFEIARRVFSRPAAVAAAVGGAILPSFVVWSVATLKETMVLSVALVALRVVQFLCSASRRDARLTDALVLLLAMLVLLMDLRSTVAATIVGLLAIVYAARTHFRPRGWQLVAGVLALVVVLGGLSVARARSSNRPITAAAEDVMLQIRHRRAQEAAAARTQLRPETEVLSPTGSELPAAEAASDAAPFSVVDDVLDPLGYALFAPAPWQAQSLTELAASAEMPIWYVLLGASFVAWRAAPRQPLFVVCLAAYGVANWLVLAAVEGNLGNLLRHRLTLDPVLVILGSGGGVWLWTQLTSLQLFPRGRQPMWYRKANQRP